MRIAYNALPLLLPRAGIARYLLSLTREIRDLRPDVELGFFHLNRVLPEPPPDRAAAPGPLRRLLLATHRRLPLAALHRPLLERRFAGAVRPDRYDLYHETHFAPLPFAGPTVLTVYDLSLRLLPETHPAPRVELFERVFPRSLDRITRFLAISGSVKDDLCRHFAVDPGRVTVTPLGYDPRVFHPPSAGEPDAEGGRATGARPPARETGTRGSNRPRSRDRALPARYVLAVGTLEARKNAPTLVAAYAALPLSLRREAPLLWAGAPGWRSAPLARLARAHGVRGQVRRLGYVADERLADLYRGATVFAFPSLYEGFGLPALEALACGTPVVCSDVAAVREVVGDVALVAPATDVSAWTEALRRLLEDADLRERLRVAGPLRARTFTWEMCARVTLAAYEAAVGEVTHG